MESGWNPSWASGYARFDDALVEVQFPAMSAPFLGLLCKLCMDKAQSMQEDTQNILIIHCATGKGRTAAVDSCLLAFSGCYSSPFTALQVISTAAIGNARGVQSSKILLASQRRYVHYFQHILNGVRPQPQGPCVARKHHVRVCRQNRGVFVWGNLLNWPRLKKARRSLKNKSTMRVFLDGPYNAPRGLLPLGGDSPAAFCVSPLVGQARFIGRTCERIVQNQPVRRGAQSPKLKTPCRTCRMSRHAITSEQIEARGVGIR
jgi:hypothetical protein